MFQTTFEGLRLGESEVLHLEVLFLIGVKLASQFFVYFGDLEVLPKGSHAEHIVADVDDLHEGIVALGKNTRLAFQGGLTSPQF
jgi:hypothetical protein